METAEAVTGAAGDGAGGAGCVAGATASLTGGAGASAAGVTGLAATTTITEVDGASEDEEENVNRELHVFPGGIDV